MMHIRKNLRLIAARTMLVLAIVTVGLGLVKLLISNPQVNAALIGYTKRYFDALRAEVTACENRSRMETLLTRELRQAPYRSAHGEIKAKALYCMTTLSYDDGDLAVAESYGEDLVDYEPLNYKNYMLLATIYQARGKNNRSLEAWRSALEIMPGERTAVEQAITLMSADLSQYAQEIVEYYERFLFYQSYFGVHGNSQLFWAVDGDGFSEDSSSWCMGCFRDEDAPSVLAFSFSLQAGKKDLITSLRFDPLGRDSDMYFRIIRFEAVYQNGERVALPTPIAKHEVDVNGDTFEVTGTDPQLQIDELALSTEGLDRFEVVVELATLQLTQELDVIVKRAYGILTD